jgi:hypothetical protein
MKNIIENLAIIADNWQQLGTSEQIQKRSKIKISLSGFNAISVAVVEVSQQHSHFYLPDVPCLYFGYMQGVFSHF